MEKCILAYDLGTSGLKTCLFDINGQLLASYFKEYNTIYPEIGWAEQNPNEWWNAIIYTTRELLNNNKVLNKNISCVSFSGQMMGCVPVDKKGRLLRNAIIWADQRGVHQINKLINKIGKEKIYEITGHRPSASYSAAKIIWVKDNEKNIYDETYKFLHVKDYIALKLTNNFITDYSDASGMNLLDIKKKNWSYEILDAIELDNKKLPNLKYSLDVVGEITKDAAKETGLSEGIPVVAGGGDGPCAAVGSGIVEENEAYNYIGTSSWIGLASKEPFNDKKMRIFNWIHLCPNMYSPTGTMQAAGGSYNWLRNIFCLIENKISEDLDLNVFDIMDMEASSVEPCSMNLIYLPYLQGERSPYWNPNARGAFIGLSSKHKRAHIIRSTLEGIIFNLKVILEIFEEFMEIKNLILIGGGAKGNLLKHIVSDIYNKPVLIPVLDTEATSLGAAITGGVGIGLYKDFNVIKDIIKIKETINPVTENSLKYNELFKVFKECYYSLINIYEKLAKFN